MAPCLSKLAASTPLPLGSSTAPLAHLDDTGLKKQGLQSPDEPEFGREAGGRGEGREDAESAVRGR